MSVMYSGIEEAVEIAGSLGISDFKSAFLFLKKKTGQVYAQLFCEEENVPVRNRDKDMIYCGRLANDQSYSDIYTMVQEAERKSEEDENYAEWLEEHGFFRY